MSSELLDIYNDRQEHIGTAPRDEVHAKGYLHHTFHCWIFKDTPAGRKILFQKRQDTKDTFPGFYDITAAGHLTAGETVNDSIREIEEELGIPLTMDQLIPLGTVDYEARGVAGGKAFIDRETCHIFGCQLDLPLTSYSLQAEEVAGLFEADLEQTIRLLLGDIDTLPAVGIEPKLPDKRFPEPFHCIINVHHFVPHNSDYYLRIFRKLAEL